MNDIVMYIYVMQWSPLGSLTDMKMWQKFLQGTIIIQNIYERSLKKKNRRKQNRQSP